MRGLYAVVDGLSAARDQLLARGVEVSEIRQKAPRDEWRGAWAPGLDPDRADYASFADFSDPDGNRWALQERVSGPTSCPPPRRVYIVSS